MTLYLKEIEQSDGNDIYEMFQELPKVELGSENIANGMTKKEFEDYKKKLVDNSKGINLKKNETQKINYILYENDGRPIGSVALRPTPNKYWREHSGHIGYSIRPSQRGKGYGNVILGLVLAKARNNGLNEVFLQCDKDNLASQKVIENNGGVRIKEDESIYYKIKLDDDDLTDTIKKLEDFFEITAPYYELVIMHSRKEFDLIAGRKTHDWNAGYANHNTIFVIHPDKLEKFTIHKKDSHPKRLAHEMSHLFFNKLSNGSYRPLWLNEGLAYILAEQKIRALSEDDKLAAPDYFSNQGQEVYGIGVFMTRTLIEKFGKEKILSLIKKLTQGITELEFNILFKEVYGFDFTKEELKKIA